MFLKKKSNNIQNIKTLKKRIEILNNGVKEGKKLHTDNSLKPTQEEKQNFSTFKSTKEKKQKKITEETTPINTDN